MHFKIYSTVFLEKNGLLRDKAQYTNILSKADDNLLKFINRSFISLLRNLITNVFITTCS